MLWECLAVRQLLMLASFTVIRGMEPSIRADLLQLTNEPNSTIYIRNNSLFLVPCEAAGEDPVKVYWRNESVMNSRAVLINTTTKGLWFMSGVQRSGSPKVHRVGTFRCMASNTAGVVMGKKFELNFIYLQNISVKLLSPVLYRNVVRLKCSVETNHPVKYTWFRNNIELNGSRRMDVQSSGVLRIRDYRISDNGSYSCQAESAYNAITSRAVDVVGEMASKSRIHIYPDKVVRTVVGNPVKIECIQTGPKLSFVSWSKVSEQSSRTLVNGSGFADLFFESIKLSDAGKYRCLAKDGVEETVIVSVGAPPIFTSKLPATVKLIEKESLVLTCNVTTNSTVSVKWYKNGRALVQDSRVHFYTNAFEHKLVVRKMAGDDNGVYQCEVENEHGSSIDQTIVNVQDRMDAPEQVAGYALSSTKINISWRIPPGYERVSVVVHRLNFDIEKNVQVNVQEVIPDKRTYHVIRELRPYVKYWIRLQLIADGKSRGKSSVFSVTTLEEAPSGPPNEIELKSYSKGTLDITWLPPFKVKRNGKIISYEIEYYTEGGGKPNCLTVTENFYSATLRNLTEGAKYNVKIAAKTKAGVGEFSSEWSYVVSRGAKRAIMPAPLVNIRNSKVNIVVKVTSPSDVAVKGYIFKYRLMGMYMGVETIIEKNVTAFDYVLSRKESNLEYVVIVTSIGSKTRTGRPTILVVPANTAQTNVSKTMFGRSNYTENRDMNISCKPIRNETAISVKWEQKATRYKPEFEVRYKRAGDDMNPFTVIETKYFNWTISPVVAGTTYTVQVTAKFPQNPVLIYIPVLAYCGVPEKKPETPPRDIQCQLRGSIVVVIWRRPSKPNGHIVRYYIRWLRSNGTNQTQSTDSSSRTSGHVNNENLMHTMKDIKRDTNFTVTVWAENSVGQSPHGQCTMDTSGISTERPSKKVPNKTVNTGDIEKGIIIGCIISVLVLFILVMFVCWSGCRRNKKNARAVQNRPPYSSKTSLRPDTVSTEVSDMSVRHHQLLKKFLDEETSKESDRGVGMTPKSSRLYLDSEKMPFLPRSVNPDGSVDTSCDSQDSGVEGLVKKKSSVAVEVKDSDKTPLTSEDTVVETIC